MSGQSGGPGPPKPPDIADQRDDNMLVDVSCDSQSVSEVTNNVSGNKKSYTNSSADAENIYAESDRGPYCVFVEHKVKNIGRLFPVRVGHYLKLDSVYKGKVVDIKAVGINKVKVIFNSREAANSLIADKTLNDNNLVAYIPVFFNHKKGVVKMVDTFFSEEYLMGSIESDRIVTDVKRLLRKTIDEASKKEVLVKLQVIVVTFKGSTLPTNIQINSVNFDVEPYVHPVVICYHCMRYGHTSKMCRGKSRCAKCGETHSNNGENGTGTVPLKPISVIGLCIAYIVIALIISPRLGNAQNILNSKALKKLWQLEIFRSKKQKK